MSLARDIELGRDVFEQTQHWRSFGLVEWNLVTCALIRLRNVHLAVQVVERRRLALLRRRKILHSCLTWWRADTVSRRTARKFWATRWLHNFRLAHKPRFVAECRARLSARLVRLQRELRSKAFKLKPGEVNLYDALADTFESRLTAALAKARVKARVTSHTEHLVRCSLSVSSFVARSSVPGTRRFCHKDSFLDACPLRELGACLFKHRKDDLKPLTVFSAAGFLWLWTDDSDARLLMCSGALQARSVQEVGQVAVLPGHVPDIVLADLDFSGRSIWANPRLDTYVGNLRDVLEWRDVPTCALVWLAKHCEGQLLLSLLKKPRSLSALKVVAPRLGAWRDSDFCVYNLAWLRSAVGSNADLVWFLLRCLPVVRAVGNCWAFHPALLRYGLDRVLRMIKEHPDKHPAKALLASAPDSLLSLADVSRLAAQAMLPGCDGTEMDALTVLHELKHLGPMAASAVLDFLGTIGG